VDLQLAGQRVRLADLLRAPLRDTDVVGLARVHDVGERLHRLLERRAHVVPVGLVEVDVVGLQPAQRAVDGLHDVLAGEAAVVWPGAGRPVDLREDLQPFAALALERAAEHRLGAGARVHVGGVEGGDAHVEGGPHARERGLLLDLGAVGDPVAVRDLADEHAGTAKVTELHA
jgi:hypothetical protein